MGNQLAVVSRAQIQSHYRCQSQIDVEQILLFDANKVFQPIFASVFSRGFDSQRIDIAPDGTATVPAGCGNKDAAVATAQIVHYIVFANIGQLQHGIDHIVRRRDVHNIRNALGGGRLVAYLGRFGTCGTLG